MRRRLVRPPKGTKRPWIKREPDNRSCPICQKMINNRLNRYFCSKPCESEFRTGLAFTANPNLVIACKWAPKILITVG